MALKRVAWYPSGNNILFCSAESVCWNGMRGDVVRFRYIAIHFWTACVVIEKHKTLGPRPDLCGNPDTCDTVAARVPVLAFGVSFGRQLLTARPHEWTKTSKTVKIEVGRLQNVQTTF